MAKDNIEVEIKLQVSEQDFLKARDWLAKNSKLAKTSKQEDEYFTPAHKDFMKPKHPFEWLSIRKRGGLVQLNYKHYHPEDVEETTYCDEFETEVSDLGNARRLFKAIGMKSLAIVNKERESYVYKNDFEISLDKVEDLGFFIEIEALADFGGEEKTREKVIEIAKVVGLNPKTELRNKGYPLLLMEKNGLL